MNWTGKIAEQARKLYTSLSPRARVIVAASVLLVGGALSYLLLSDHTRYEPLFTGLATEDAAKITEELRKAKVPFRLSAGGATVLVPADQKHETRLSLAGKGLPRGSGVGFEIFDSQKLGLSDFAQRINYRRALQGEMERTISQFNVVHSTRVHLALPKNQLFARRRQPVSASVTLQLQPGRTLPGGHVKAIVHLVSSAVAGLQPDAVTVVDTSGKMLWSGHKGTDGAVGALDRKHSLEDRLERKVSEQLSVTLGPGHAMVSVTVDLDRMRMEQMDTMFDPEKSAIRSESSLQEENNKAGATPRGIPGVRGNLPGGPAPGAGNAKGESSRKKKTTNYEINKIVRKKVMPAGEIRRLTVAVSVDSAILAGGAAGAGAAKKEDGKKGDKDDKKVAAAAAPKIDLVALEELIKSAVGYSSRRGDRVVVKAIPFAPGNDRPEALGPVARILKTSKEFMTPAIILVLAIAALVALRRWRSRKKETDVIELPMTVKELETGARGDPLALGDGDQNARDLANAAADHDAKRAAAVLRAWIAEG